MRWSLFLLGLIVSMSVSAQDYSGSYGSRDRSYSYSSRSDTEIGVGVASNSTLLRTSETAIAGLFNVGRKMAIQAMFVMPQSNPSQYGMAGIYKYSVLGGNSGGLHIGGALGIGSYPVTSQDSKTFWRLGFISGVHFTAVGRVAISVDAGLTMADDGENSDTQLVIGGHSSVWGLSIFYLL